MAQLYTSLFLLFSLTKITLAAPTLTEHKTSFSVPAIPKRSDSMLRKRQTGTVEAALTDFGRYRQISYTCPVTIGGQTLKLQFDTGGTRTWIFSTEMPPNMQENHNVFNPSLSSTYQDTGIPFKIKYPDGDSAAGKIGTDNMNVGGVLVANQGFGVANTASRDFVTGDADGILDLSLRYNIRGTILPTFIGNAAQVLSVPLFAAYLPHRANGAFDFGIVNSDRYTGPIMYTTVQSTNYLWKVDSTAYKVGSVEYDAPGVTAIIDSGTEWIYVQSSQARMYYNAVPNSRLSGKYKGWVYPCLQILPSISFLIGPTHYATIPGANLVTGLQYEHGRLCHGGVQDEVLDNSVNLYGLPFFSAYYCIFDFKTPVFGFADIAVPP